MAAPRHEEKEKLLQVDRKKGALIKEYRVPLPISVEEYRIGQLFSVAKASLAQTGGGEGVEVLLGEDYDDGLDKGYYMHKVYHLESQIPSYIKAVVPAKAMHLHEKSWNAYPWCDTVSKSPYMKEDFRIEIISWHAAGGPTIDNALNLPDDVLAAREVVLIDIAEKDNSDTPLGRDLEPGWYKAYDGEMMTAYKVVVSYFKWWGLQGTVQRTIHNFNKSLFHSFHRQVIACQPEWKEMDMKALREFEAETEAKLAEQLKEKEKRSQFKVPVDDGKTRTQ